MILASLATLCGTVISLFALFHNPKRQTALTWVLCFLIMAVGVLHGVQSFREESEKKGMKTILGLATVHLNESATKRMEIERDTAWSLYAFAFNMTPLLKKTSMNNFIIGYRLYLNGKWDEAKEYFEKSAKEDKFVAPSRYLLAYMDTHTNDKDRNLIIKDWGADFDQLDTAISYDENYTPSYYLRGKLNANKNSLDKAFEDLEKALMHPRFGVTTCNDLNQAEEQNKYFGKLKADKSAKKRLEDLTNKCIRFHGAVKDHKALPYSSSQE